MGLKTDYPYGLYFFLPHLPLNYNKIRLIVKIFINSDGHAFNFDMFSTNRKVSFSLYFFSFVAKPQHGQFK